MKRIDRIIAECEGKVCDEELDRAKNELSGKPWKQILKHPDAPYWACWYSKHVLKCRFHAGEKSIATDPGYSYLYSRYVIKVRFPAGEDAIATDPDYSYSYAMDVIKKRFRAGEEAIATDPYYSIEYQKLIERERTQ